MSWLRLTFIQVILWLKTNLHPEALGGGGRRERPRRSTDRRRERLQKFWLLFLTGLVLWMGLTIRHDQHVTTKIRLDGTHQRCELSKIIIQTAIHLGVPPNSPDLNDLRRNLHDCRALERETKKELQ